MKKLHKYKRKKLKWGGCLSATVIGRMLRSSLQGCSSYPYLQLSVCLYLSPPSWLLTLLFYTQAWGVSGVICLTRWLLRKRFSSTWGCWPSSIPPRIWQSAVVLSSLLFMTLLWLRPQLPIYTPPQITRANFGKLSCLCCKKVWWCERG